MPKGSLGELLHSNSCQLDWRMRYQIAIGASEGLAYLHHDCKPRIIHRDIKSNNILLDEKFEAHVGDFGLAKLIDVSQSKSMSVVAGSYGYIAPGKSWILSCPHIIFMFLIHICSMTSFFQKIILFKSSSFSCNTHIHTCYLSSKKQCLSTDILLHAYYGYIYLLISFFQRQFLSTNLRELNVTYLPKAICAHT